MTTTEKKTAPEKKTTTEKKTAPAKKRPARKSPEKKATATTAEKKAPETDVKGITPPVKTDDVDWEFQRRHQSKPLSKDEVQELLMTLAKFPELEVEVKNKCYYGLNIRHKGQTLGEYWAKRDFPRVVITDKRRADKKLPIDWTSRTAFRAEHKGSTVEIEATAEIVCTPEEAIEIFIAMAKQSKQSKQSSPEKTE